MRFAVTPSYGIPATSVLRYIGRFAPSPTGPLHLGSLAAACASYLDAKAVGGEWLIRMEDVDTTRNVPGSDRHILEQLKQFGFVWDRPVLYQTSRNRVYEAVLQRLQHMTAAFPCVCSRKETGPLYPGTCRDGLAAGSVARSWRVLAPHTNITFTDRVYGRITQNLATEVGDFVVKRADDQFAYQLAVVVDDAEQGVTHIVRGADLLDSTPRQIYLQRLLGYSQPSYLHIPLVTNHAGEKLSKQTRAPAVEGGDRHALRTALAHLGLDVREASPADMLRVATEQWGQGAVEAMRQRLPQPQS